MEMDHGSALDQPWFTFVKQAKYMMHILTIVTSKKKMVPLLVASYLARVKGAELICNINFTHEGGVFLQN